MLRNRFEWEQKQVEISIVKLFIFLPFRNITGTFYFVPLLEGSREDQLIQKIKTITIFYVFWETTENCLKEDFPSYLAFMGAKYGILYKEALNSGIAIPYSYGKLELFLMNDQNLILCTHK